MQCSFFKNKNLKKPFVFCLSVMVLLISLYSISWSASDKIRKGKYTITVNVNQTMSGSRYILELDGEILGPACSNMKLTVNYMNEYANRAHNVILIENIQENTPLKFSGFDEVFPIKPETTWKLDEVYAVCQD